MRSRARWGFGAIGVFTLSVLSTTCGGGGGGTGGPNPPPSGQTPTISILPLTQNVALGASASLSLTITGSPAPSVICSAVLGTETLNGNAIGYTAPSSPPSGFPSSNNADSITCKATNSAG